MPKVDPQVILRLGSHSEKEYVEKTLRYFDGVMVGANLLQATPGATASLLLKLWKESGRPYYVDPMTYAFGAYVDPESSVVRNDLDWIKSDQKVRGGRKGQIVRDFKSSYRKLADDFGPPFTSALERKTAVDLSDFPTQGGIDDVCKSVLEFQADRLRRVFRDDPETKDFANDLPVPTALFAPYFYIENSQAPRWIELNRRLAFGSANRGNGTPVHVVVCGHRDLLNDQVLSSQIVEYLLECKPSGVWLWFSRFDEHLASVGELTALRWWVERLSPVTRVFNMHGGFFSMALSRVGMSGIAHGVGYGEQKDVVPVIGQSTPTVQYYVRELHGKYSVVEIMRSFSALNIKGQEDFFGKVCDCVVCKGVIGDQLSKFVQFGEIHYSSPKSRRAAQTPAAAKRCRFHFLLNRIQEREYVRPSSLDAIAAQCTKVVRNWAGTLLGSKLGYLNDWATVLQGK